MPRLDVLVLGLNYAPETTGIAPYTTGMARALADAGHDVHVVTGLPHYPQWRVAPGYRGLKLRHEERDGDVRVTRVRHPIPARPTGVGRVVMEAAFALATATVRHRRPDVVIAVSPALLTVAAALARRGRPGRGGRPAVGVVVQDLYGSVVAEAGVLGGRGGGAVAALERALLRRADGVAAVHEVFRAGLTRSAVRAEAVSVIRNWTHVGRPTGCPTRLRETLFWPAEHTVALHAGNMGAKQNLENVVEAARLAQARDLPVTFVLLGAGNQRHRLLELAAGCDRLRFADPLPDGEFETALAAADVLLVNERPSISEMCVPSKLTSYFAAGRPVVAATSASSPAAREVSAAGAGIVVEPGRPELLLEATVALGMGGAEAAEHLGGHGRRYAATRCSAAAPRRAYTAWVATLGLLRSGRSAPALPLGVPAVPVDQPAPGGLLALRRRKRRTVA
ncbi:glycosyltransferase [Actinomycetospora chlora]|uniref:glycosyltransferase n=1 Tax=Actinomycetospora chlora TaxID=663608 RepID=UPI0031EECC7B